MPHLTNPTGFRLIKNRDWQSTWFADKKHYRDYFLEDKRIRGYLDNKLKTAGLEKVEIERSPNDVRVTVSVSRPGLVIGRGGSGIETVKRELQGRIVSRLKNFNVLESKKAGVSAKIIGETIASQLLRRYPYRRAVEGAMNRAMEAGALGIKVEVGGRLGGLERARTEKKSKGEVPTSTFDSLIDYAFTIAQTKYGTIGIKVWVHRSS